MMAVQVAAGAEFRAGAPVLLFRARLQPINWLRSYDVGPDGRFLVVLRDSAPTRSGAAHHVQLVRGTETPGADEVRRRAETMRTAHEDYS